VHNYGDFMAKWMDWASNLGFVKIYDKQYFLYPTFQSNLSGLLYNSFNLKQQSKFKKHKVCRYRRFGKIAGQRIYTQLFVP
jgi:hypothetical protein